MKHYFSILFAGAALSVSAQNPSTVTIINSADVGFPNFQYTYATDTSTGSFDPGPGSTGWTTDFTTLSSDETNTIRVLDIVQTPYANQYPQADMVLESSYGISAIVANTSNSFTVLDEVNPLLQGQFNFHYLSADTVLNYSLALNNAWSDSSATSITMFYGADPGNGVIADSMRIISGKAEYNFVDGEGNCITESGTYTCLRILTAGTVSDYLEFYQNGVWVPFGMMNQAYTLTYTWWAKTSGLWVAKCEIEPLSSQIISVSRLTNVSTFTGVDEVGTVNTALIYPNPANDILTVEITDGEGTVEIIDMTGRVVKTAIITSTVTKIDVADLAPGMYTYRVVGQNQQGKVQVAH